MKRDFSKGWLACLLALGLGCLAAAAPPLTKDDVKRMAKAGQSDGAILGAIQDAHAVFNLTADDIADLRNAGVSERIIDIMIATGPVQPGDESVSAEAAQTEPGDSSESSEDQTGEPDYYQGAPSVAYPVYPLYYPAYYPVYDPFFPFFDGFFFSFEFVHVSRRVAVFPCDRAVLVLDRPFVRGVFASRPALFSTPRSSLQGRLGNPAGGPIRGTSPLRSSGGGRSAPTFPPRVAPRFAGPRSSLGPSPHRMGMPYRSAPGARPQHFPGPPSRVAPPSFRAPRTLSAPRGASPGRGGMHGFSAPRGGGGGHGRGGRR